MNRPSRVHRVGLQALPRPPSVHSALMLGHARNVHTYRYKHKHLGMAWKLVAGYLTFLTWKTLANFGDWSLQEKYSAACLFKCLKWPLFRIFWEGPCAAVRIMAVVCQKQRWKQRDVVTAPQKTLWEEVWMDDWVTQAAAVCIPFHWCQYCFLFTMTMIFP